MPGVASSMRQRPTTSGRPEDPARATAVATRVRAGKPMAAMACKLRGRAASPLLDGAIERLLLLALAGPGPLVLKEGHPFHLPLELAPALQSLGRKRAVVEGGDHRAAGLTVVAAVAEPATSQQSVDLGEGPLHAIVGLPQKEAAEAGRVDEDASARRREQVAVGRGVATAAVRLTDGRRLLHVGPEDPVDE